MADEIGIAVISLDLDTTKFDKKMKSVNNTLSKNIGSTLKNATTHPAMRKSSISSIDKLGGSSLSGNLPQLQWLEVIHYDLDTNIKGLLMEISGKLSRTGGGLTNRGPTQARASSGGKGNAGILSQMGVKGMAPYMRFGKGGAYGGLSGIDVIGTIKGLFGSGAKAGATAGGGAGLAGGSGAGAGAAGAGAAGMGAAAIPVVGAILAGVMIIKKIWNMIKNTQVFKYVKTISQAVMGTLATVLALPYLIANKFKPFTDTLKSYFERIKSINERLVAILEKLQDGAEIIRERILDIKDKISEGLVDLGLKLIGFKLKVEDFVTNTIAGAKEGVTGFVDGLKGKMATVATDVSTKFKEGFTAVKESVMGPEGLGGKLKTAGSDIVTKIQTSIDTVLSIPEKLFTMFYEKLLRPLALGILGFVSEIATFFNKALHKISGGLLGSSEKPSD